MFAPQNRERFERLSSLSPVAAVQAWLDGDFGIGDEPALIQAIRKDKRIKLSDSQIIDVMADMMFDAAEGDLVEASSVLELLAIAE
ncbi:MAG: hypothetical protein ACK58N_02895 [Synechocystis sp.]|jgi:hypothetical protein